MLKKIIDALFNSVGLKICRRNTYRTFKLQYKDLVKEIEGLYLEIVFPELPSSNNRIDLLIELTGTQVSEAMYILAFLHKSLQLEGDVCEFGIAQGATSALLANEIRTTEKKLYLFDSFKGLSRPSKKDVLIDDFLNLGSMEKYEGVMSYSVDHVKSRLKAISFPFLRVKIIPGFIEETINSKGSPDKICFAYIDFDLYNPTLTTLEFLDKHLLVGGSIVVDDYGYFSSGVKKAVDEFIGERPGNYEIILPYKIAGLFCILNKKAEIKD